MVTIREAEADMCPRCKRHMKQVTKTTTRTPDGDPCYLYAYVCETEGCAWEGTGRAIQTDMRGNVFQRDRGPRGMDKDFPALSPDALFRGKIAVEEVLGVRIEDDKNIPSFTQLEKERLQKNQINEIERR